MKKQLRKIRQRGEATIGVIVFVLAAAGLWVGFSPMPELADVGFEITTLEQCEKRDAVLARYTFFKHASTIIGTATDALMSIGTAAVGATEIGESAYKQTTLARNKKCAELRASVEQ